MLSVFKKFLRSRAVIFAAGAAAGMLYWNYRGYLESVNPFILIIVFIIGLLISLDW